MLGLLSSSNGRRTLFFQTSGCVLSLVGGGVFARAGAPGRRGRSLALVLPAARKERRGVRQIGHRFGISIGGFDFVVKDTSSSGSKSISFHRSGFTFFRLRGLTRSPVLVRNSPFCSLKATGSTTGCGTGSSFSIAAFQTGHDRLFLHERFCFGLRAGTSMISSVRRRFCLGLLAGILKISSSRKVLFLSSSGGLTSPPA